jgi:TM2 domain-containing membrane protein YozV
VVLINITHGDNDSTQVRIVTELEIPELEIVNFAITTIPVEYRDVTVSLAVVNHGPGRAINSKAIFYFDGEPVATVAIPVLEEGELKVLEASWHVPFGSIGKHELESRVFVGENQVEHEVGNNIYVSRIDVLPNWNIWIPIITALSGYLIILVTSRMAFNSRLSNTLGYYDRVNQKVRLENQLKLIQESQQRVGIMGTLRWSVRAHILLGQAKSEIEHVERIYRQVLDRRDELFNMVSMLKARGLGHLEAEKTLEEVQAELNALRPEGYEGLEMPDAEKYEGKSIEDLETVQKELAETLAAEENEEIPEAQIIEEDEE